MEKIKLAFRENKRRFIIIGCVVLLCIVAALGIIYFALRNKSDIQGERPGGMGERQSDGSIVASGTTMVGMVEDSYDIDYLEDDLYIEKVYISSGDEVKEGDPILKLSEDTVSAGQRQLEKAVTQAELDYRSGVVSYNLSKVDEQNTYDLSIKNGELAASVYADKLASIDENLTSLQEQIADKQEDIQEYQDAIDNDTYYDKYDVGYWKNVYETNYGVFNERVNEWNLAQYLETCDTDYSRYQFVSTGGNASGSGSASSGTGSSSNGTGSTSSTVQVSGEEKEQLNQMTTFLKRVYEYLDKYEAAQDAYEAAKKDAAVQLEKCKVELESLQLQLQEAQLTYEADQNEAKANYESAVAEAGAAQSTYNTAIKKLDEDLEAKQNDKEDAEDNLAHFEELVGDGYFRASSNGTARVVTSQAATDLTDDTMVMAYSNPDTVTVTVAIDQSYIAQLAIGDKATVAIEDHDDFDAVITQIQPTSSSTSRSSVTYNVEVTLEGDVSDLDVNLTAVVTFPSESQNATETSDTADGIDKIDRIDSSADMGTVSENQLREEGLTKESTQDSIEVSTEEQVERTSGIQAEEQAEKTSGLQAEEQAERTSGKQTEEQVEEQTEEQAEKSSGKQAEQAGGEQE
ncbi:MAG: HlyD family efflux transporter periplasmic adaptor subunit [Lachnospiraceae bacterium]|nr:HlyD family efflux transporter periplasmic adaptor subunit [Lachnospiraceae bacterium]